MSRSSSPSRLQCLQLATSDLSSNTIAVLPEGLFTKLTMLRHLELSSNAITSLQEGLFERQTKLNHLYVRFVIP
ncbi:hypothetical protein pdam_00007937 [Pocillopora damicornis]|uniref:Uncharacterized protein n=1 Tax=Pocillopora damicornis TaxID=46731 RepID=A0A3M6UFB9_POCDA|nr:hypothetical protein pdam_00007937 [Pocillopora damicornis]